MNQTRPRPQGEPWRLPIGGMTCASCVGRVERALRQVPGVLRADIHLGQELALVDVAPGTALAPLVAAVEGAGYTVRTQTHTLAIQDMTCASCVGRVERALRQVPGVLDATVNLATEQASVRTLATTPVEAPQAAVGRAG